MKTKKYTLREYIKSTGKTYSQFARDIGVSRQFLHQWMVGIKPIPKNYVDLILKDAGRIVLDLDVPK